VAFDEDELVSAAVVTADVFAGARFSPDYCQVARR
jgi:hypothetical protein